MNQKEQQVQQQKLPNIQNDRVTKRLDTFRGGVV